jgi:hypothetical protein
MHRFATGAVALGVALAVATTTAAAGSPPRRQSDAAFAASYAANGVVNVSATTQRVSCYAPEVPYATALGAADGYPGGGETPCPGATTGSRRAASRRRTSRIRRCSSRITRVRHPGRPARTRPHLIGQSKWFVSAEGYNHLNGFYESWDGGATWPVQGHVPGYEGWTDNTDPVGAFDPWGNFYSLLLPYVFVYDKSGGHVFNNGSKQANPGVPPEAISVAVHPAAPAGSQSATNWITTHDGHPDYVFTGAELGHKYAGQAVDRDRHEPVQPALRARVRDVHAVRAQPVEDPALVRGRTS